MITEPVVQTCGTSEFTQRCLIIKSISESKSTNGLIQEYLENDFHTDYARRYRYSQRHDFGYSYERNPSYFDYFPLRHRLDSLMTIETGKVLKLSNINQDERLICVLFTEGINSFKSEVDKRKFRKSKTKKFMYKSYRDYRDYFIGRNIFFGAVSPLSKDDVFGINPYIGYGFSSPMYYKTVVDVSLKVRFNMNDRTFNYYAMDRLNEVDSKSNLNFGFSVSRRINRSEKFRIYPKAGLGLEVIHTGLSERKNGEDEDTHYDLTTFNLTTGFLFLSPIHKRDYLGLGINYHLCPYGLDKNLKTPISNSLLSTELVYRF